MSAATLGARIRARREELQLSLQGLADQTRGVVSKSTLSGIENGQTPNPGLDKLRALAGALGWTLDELDGVPASGVRAIQLQHLQPDPNNPRVLQEDDAADHAFLQSIREVGLIQPLAVRPLYSLAEDGRKGASSGWRVVDGHRRYAALVAIHGPKSKTLVPCLIKEADETQTLLLQLVANVQRADMNPWDLAKAIGELVDQKMDTQAIADALGRKRRWVQEMASVGKHLGESGQLFLKAGTISISQAVALAAERDPKEQNRLVIRAQADKLNEDEIRALIADRKAKATAAEASKQVDIEDLVPPAKAADIHRRWAHKRGYLEVTIEPEGEHAFRGSFQMHWRLGGMGGGAGEAPRKTAAIAFMVAARRPYQGICQSVPEHPEDMAAAVELHRWISETIERLGGTPSDLATWRKDYPPPEKPAPKASARPAATAPKPQPFDATKPPTWATLEWLAGPFMFHEGRRAWLVHGWPKLIEVIRDEDGPVIQELYNRSAWQSDADGAPFDFGSCVVKLTHARP